MSGQTLFVCGLAVVCGFLAQQVLETLLNTALTVLPFKIQTVR